MYCLLLEQTSSRNKMYICKYCLASFLEESTLEPHKCWQQNNVTLLRRLSVTYALTVPFGAGSGPTSAAVHSSSAAGNLSRLHRLCPAVSRRAQSSGRFFSFFIPPICWGSSNSMSSFLICMLTTRRSSATLLRLMSCSNRSGFRDAWMTLLNGCSLIVFKSTQPRRKCYGVHPFDVSIRFHSPVCVSASTSLFRLLLSETSEYIWTVTSAWGLMSLKWCPAVSRCCGDSAAFVRRLRGQSLCRSSCHWFCLALTTAMPHSPASRIGRWTDCGPCSTRLRWLRYPDRIDYKLAVLVYRCLHGLVRATSPTNSRVCRRLGRDGVFGRLRRPSLSCLASSGRHSAVVHSLWQRLKHGTVYCHMSHHLQRWRLSNAVSRLNCSWDRTFKPDIGYCSTSCFWLCYVPSKSTLIYVTLIIFVIIIIIINDF